MKGLTISEYGQLLETINKYHHFHLKIQSSMRIKYVESSFHSTSGEIWRVNLRSKDGEYEFATNSLVPLLTIPESLSEYTSISELIYLFLNGKLRDRDIFKRY